jgi:hypothetical protein
VRKPRAIIGDDDFEQLVFEGYAVVPAEATPDAVGAWWRCKNGGGSDYDAYLALIAVASGEKRPEDLWEPKTI